ncbi:CHIA chitinase, partial [Atractosteus spatula]|nr:CHIA chitinase [Atractosteus spatula]
MPTNIDPCLCTHLLYAFATMKDNKLATYEWNDVELYSEFNALKNKNGNLKTLLSVGGWNFGSSGFSNMVAQAGTRQIFINSVIEFLRQYEFDGLDIDWEYPANRGSPPQDQQLYSVLLEEMRAAFEKEAQETHRARLLMSAAVSSGLGTIQSAYQIPKLGQALDMINVMTYDMHGSWETFTGENSPLYRGPADQGGDIYFNINYAMNYWKDNGAPAEKLLVGFPTYGQTFTLRNAADHGVGAPISGAGAPGKYTQEAGELAYFEICGFLEGATFVWNEVQDVPYAYKGTQWVGFDNIRSFGIKAQWLMKNNFGGAMVWTLDMDDYLGTFCNQGKNPLINVLHKAFGLDQVDEEYGRDSGPPSKKIRASSREVKPKKRPGKNSQEDSEDSDDKAKSKDDSADDFGSEDDNDFEGEEEEEEEGGDSDYDGSKKGKKGKKPKVERTAKRTPKSRKRPADDSDDDREVSKKVRQQRQAASKAVSKQREMLLDDGGSEDEEKDEDDQAFLDKESGSDEDFMVDDDDDSDYGHSRKKSKKVVKRTKPDRKEKKSPKPRLKATGGVPGSPDAFSSVFN